jgi:hypothetical protein
MSDACQSLLLSSLTTYYEKHAKYRKMLHDIVESRSPLSLRVIDWFVTHYARSHQVLYWIDDRKGVMYETYPANGAHVRKFHLYLEYRAALKSYTKLFMDPFRRHERITFVLEREPLTSIETTVGQLNFFRFAISNHVIEYIQNHLEEIEEHMADYQKQMKQGGVKTEKQKKESNKHVNTVMRAPCHIRFD